MPSRTISKYQTPRSNPAKHSRDTSGTRAAAHAGRVAMERALPSQSPWTRNKDYQTKLTQRRIEHEAQARSQAQYTIKQASKGRPEHNYPKSTNLRPDQFIPMSHIKTQKRPVSPYEESRTIPRYPKPPVSPLETVQKKVLKESRAFFRDWAQMHAEASTQEKAELWNKSMKGSVKAAEIAGKATVNATKTMGKGAVIVGKSLGGGATNMANLTRNVSNLQLPTLGKQEKVDEIASVYDRSPIWPTPKPHTPKREDSKTPRKTMLADLLHVDAGGPQLRESIRQVPHRNNAIPRLETPVPPKRETHPQAWNQQQFSSVPDRHVSKRSGLSKPNQSATSRLHDMGSVVQTPRRVPSKSRKAPPSSMAKKFTKWKNYSTNKRHEELKSKISAPMPLVTSYSRGSANIAVVSGVGGGQNAAHPAVSSVSQGKRIQHPKSSSPFRLCGGNTDSKTKKRGDNEIAAKQNIGISDQVQGPHSKESKPNPGSKGVLNVHAHTPEEYVRRGTAFADFLDVPNLESLQVQTPKQEAPSPAVTSRHHSSFRRKILSRRDSDESFFCQGQDPEDQKIASQLLKRKPSPPILSANLSYQRWVQEQGRRMMSSNTPKSSKTPLTANPYAGLRAESPSPRADTPRPYENLPEGSVESQSSSIRNNVISYSLDNDSLYAERTPGLPKPSGNKPDWWESYYVSEGEMDWAAFDRDMAGLPRESKTPRAGSSSVYPDLPREAEPTAKAKARVVRSSSVYPDSQIGPFRLTGLSQVSWATNTSSSYDDEQVSPCGTMYGGRDSQYNAEMRMRGLFYQPQDIPRIPAIPDNINGKDPRDTRFYKFYDQILDRQPSPPRKT